LYEIELPADLPPGSYELHIGLYDGEGRLLLSEGDKDYWVFPDPLTIEGP
jgi:hypothetical protein